MERRYHNIYKTARKSKGLTQEKAAELLNVSVDSIRAYESDKTPVPNDICADMVTIYNADHLAIQHLRQNPLGKMILSDIVENMNCSQAILSVLGQINNVVQIRDDLISIGADGVIDTSEKSRFEQIVEELDRLKTAILNLQFADHGNKA